MGFSGVSIWQLLIVLAIVVMIFGTRKLRNLGEDLGGAVRGVRDGFGPDAELVDVVREVRQTGKELVELKDEVTKDLGSNETADRKESAAS